MASVDGKEEGTVLKENVPQVNLRDSCLDYSALKMESVETETDITFEVGPEDGGIFVDGESNKTFTKRCITSTTSRIGLLEMEIDERKVVLTDLEHRINQVKAQKE